MSRKLSSQQVQYIFKRLTGTKINFIDLSPNAKTTIEHINKRMQARDQFPIGKSPVTNESLTLEQVTQQADLLAEADGPVLAYCRSGTRCSIVWAMGKAGEMPVDEILATTAKAGYQLEGIRPTLETLAAQKG